MNSKDTRWSPLVDNCYALAKNDWIFVELIDIATDFHFTNSIETNLRYGRIISTGNPCENTRDEVILFKDNMNRFQFTRPYDDIVISCYAIKKEDIIGEFTKKEKE